MTTRNRLFISYKSEDVSIVRRVSERLCSQSIPVWMNEYNVCHDRQDKFQHLINQGIDASQYGLLFVTKAYARSSYCHVEIERLLRRIPHDRIVVLKLEESQHFAELYPRLHDRGYQVGTDEQAIYTALHQAGAIDRHLEPASTPFHPHPWHVREAGFSFDNDQWVVDTASRFSGLSQRDTLKFSSVDKTEYHWFYRDIEGHRIRLLLDYELYDEHQADYLQHRLQARDKERVRAADFEQDERQRLIDEMQRFPEEVANAYSQILIASGKHTSSASTISMEDISEIGVHMLIKEDRGKFFRHRMFTFGIKSENMIVRVYKLVLLHPQFEQPFRIRFIFCFSNDLRYFFSTVPWADQLVDTFHWINTTRTTDIQLSNDDIASARNLFGVRKKT